jgi:large subunit ribosomal protein L29
MKPRDLREMSVDELNAKAGELLDELFHLRLRRATSQLANPMKMRQTKRDLARVKTLLGERARAAGASGRTA